MRADKREVMIDWLLRVMHSAKTPNAVRSAWFLLKSEIAGRSPERIAEMEKRMGLYG